MSAPARRITEMEKKEILALEREDITDSLLRSYFACRLGQKKPRFNSYDTFILSNEYTKEPIETTVGRYIVNLYIFPEKYLKKFGYVNQPLTKSLLKIIEKQLSRTILNDEITTKEYLQYLDGGEWLGMNVVYYLGPTLNYDINNPIPEVIEKRDELFEKYKKQLDRGESDVIEKVEGELLDLAKEKISAKDNECYDFYKSGIGDFKNHYKKMSLMCGAVQDPFTKKLDVIKTNYIDGNTIQDYSKLASLSLLGGYSRGIDTQVSGYERKKIDNALQAITLDEEHSDCGTTMTLKIIIPKRLKSLFLFRYINDHGKLIQLTDDNIDKYVDKEVNLRTPLFCKSKHICNICAGDLYYKLEINNIGLLVDNMSRSSS